MRRGRFLIRALILSCAVAVLLVGPAAASASAAPPVMTRGEIIARAETALGLTYAWGRESWMPNAGSGTGSDCSVARRSN